MAVVHPPQTVGAVRSRLRCARFDVGANVVRVSLSGDLDASWGPDLDQVLRAAHDDAAIVVVDLDELASVDEAGAAVLRAAGERARRQGRRMVAVNAQAKVQDDFSRPARSASSSWSPRRSWRDPRRPPPRRTFPHRSQFPQTAGGPPPRSLATGGPPASSSVPARLRGWSVGRSRWGRGRRSRRSCRGLVGCRT